MIRQIRIFSYMLAVTPEDQANKWLANNPKIQINDIKITYADDLGEIVMIDYCIEEGESTNDA